KTKGAAGEKSKTVSKDGELDSKAKDASGEKAKFRKLLVVHHNFPRPYAVLCTPKIMAVVPYKEDASDKKTQVARMFDSIAGKYDFLNHFLSVGTDIYWRRKAVDELKALRPARILDIATGTADFAIETLRAAAPDAQVTGVDISAGMLEVGRQKLAAKNLSHRIRLELADS
nr:2-methoxy-6-polyprenyl-1,4-benzoquinol methylase, mitochondrial [Tanacetum cinerariifolium]